MLGFKNFEYALCILIFQIAFISFNQQLCFANGNRPRTNLMVKFSPFVSILDRWDQNRYNISELVPMVAKVATEFDRVLIELKGTYSYGRFPPDISSSSLLLTPLAVAKYNQLSKDSEPKLQVWLAYTETRGESALLDISRHLKYVAEKANDIYEGTVTTILFEYSSDYKNLFNILEMLRNEREFGSILFKSNFSWGLTQTAPADCGSFNETAQQMTAAKPDVVLWEFWIPSIFFNVLHQCVDHGFANQALWFHPLDSSPNVTMNMSQFVQEWRSLRTFAEKNNKSVVLSQAFDSMCTLFGNCQYLRESAPFIKDGWWRLRASTNYSSAADYIFEAKKDIAEMVNREENSINLSLIKKGKDNLATNHLGIIFSLPPPDILGFEKIDNILNSLADQGISSLIQSSYSQIVLLLDHESIGRKRSIIEELRYSLSTFSTAKTVVVLVLPRVYLDYYVQEIRGRNFPSTVISSGRLMFVLSFDTIKYEKHQKNKQLLQNPTVFSATPKVGYEFPISYCVQFKRLPEEAKTHVLAALSNSSMALFSFEEKYATLELGVNQMFQQRLVTFGACKKFLHQLKNENPELGELDVGFVMLHYESPPNVYQNEKALFNFVLYWQKLRAWAATTETTVIMCNAIDGTRYLRNGDYVREWGWWRHEFNRHGGTNGSIHRWINKKTDLFERYNTTAAVPSLTTTEVIIIGVVTTLVVIMLLVGTVFLVTRFYYRKKFLSRREVDEFFLGSHTPNSSSSPSKYTPTPSKLPYDKSRYEIEPKSFSIDHDRVLGSGEFGMVCPGKIETNAGVNVDAAVKMVNSNNFHKTTLTGLLSEIKVLAHLGKHGNVIELLGAFTGELNKGKVFVFLELGQCGSLEKYLQSLRPEPSYQHVDGPIAEGMELAEVHNYVNTDGQGQSAGLDASLSQDLYRWSKEICNGMSFLAAKHVVHADLATRNVLLNAEKTAKICDFGLSRRMYNYTNYVKQKQEPLPWKWMSPESLRLLEFNEKSDVWAYGVTLWEIYSLGDSPYAGLSWDLNFPQMLEQGFRLSQPQYNDRNMYSLMMMKCWNTNQSGRPTFEELLLLFNDSEVLD